MRTLALYLGVFCLSCAALIDLMPGLWVYVWALGIEPAQAFRFCLSTAIALPLLVLVIGNPTKVRA